MDIGNREGRRGNGGTECVPKYFGVARVFDLGAEVAPLLLASFFSHLVEVLASSTQRGGRGIGAGASVVAVRAVEG